MRLPTHITLNERTRGADCSACGMSVNVPGPKFGPIPAETMIATFVTQHAVHSRKGRPSGLTAGGLPTPAALAALLDNGGRP